MTMNDVEVLTRTFSAAHEELCGEVWDCKTKQEAVARQCLPKIKRAVRFEAKCKTALNDALLMVRELFDRPRTVVFHGVKVGFRKLQGSLGWEDEQRVVERIENLFPDRPELLNVKKSPNKTALEKLTVDELKRLGVEVTADSDVVLIKPTDSDVEKVVAALLNQTEAT
jgi:hypothetical protein